MIPDPSRSPGSPDRTGRRSGTLRPGDLGRGTAALLSRRFASTTGTGAAAAFQGHAVSAAAALRDGPLCRQQGRTAARRAAHAERARSRDHAPDDRCDGQVRFRALVSAVCAETHRGWAGLAGPQPGFRLAAGRCTVRVTGPAKRRVQLQRRVSDTLARGGRTRVSRSRAFTHAHLHPLVGATSVACGSGDAHAPRRPHRHQTFLVSDPALCRFEPPPPLDPQPARDRRRCRRPPAATHYSFIEGAVSACPGTAAGTGAG